MCTFHTRTLRTGDNTNRLVEELVNIKWHVVGLYETKRRGEGLRELSGGSWMYEAGKTEENPNTKGLALIINKYFTDYVLKIEKHSDRIISSKIKLHVKKNHYKSNKSMPLHVSTTRKQWRCFTKNLKKLWTRKPAAIT